MITRCRPLLGTFVEITVPHDRGDVVETAFAAIAHVQARMSFHDEASDLARLREAQAGEVVRVDRTTVDVLRFACDLHKVSNGLFDVTIGRSLVRAGFLPRGRITRLTDYPGTGADIAIHDDNHVSVARPSLIDLGGIAKGYAVDHAIEALIAANISEGLVNAGGDLRAIGEREWPVALRDGDGIIRHMVPLRNCALASSANLDNRRRYRGEEHSPHIGHGGKPVFTKERISIVAPTCMMADALTKIAMADPLLAETILPRYGAYVLQSEPDRR